MTQEVGLISAFTLGLKVAEHVYGVSRDASHSAWAGAIYRTLQDISSGELTLHDTPEEASADIPPIPPEFAAVPLFEETARELVAVQMREGIARAIRAHRALAAQILSELASATEEP